MANKVSVVINTLNEKPKYLYEAIRSCVLQKGVDVQVILSTVKGDSSLDMGKRFGLTIVENDHAGIYYQLNKALPYVTGDWFFCFSGNDLAMPNKCAQEIACCKKGKLICYSDFECIDIHGEVVATHRSKPYDYEANLAGQFFYDDAIMSRSVLDQFAPFREEFGNCAYWDFWLRVAETLGPEVFAYCPGSMGIQYRMLKTSQHSLRKGNRKAKAKYEAEKAMLRRAHKSS